MDDWERKELQMKEGAALRGYADRIEGPKQPKPQTPFESSVERLANKIEQHAHALDRLRERVNDFLAPSLPRAAGSEAGRHLDKVPESHGRALEALGLLGLRIDEQTEKVADILERLET